MSSDEGRHFRDVRQILAPKVPLLKELNKCVPLINLGLAPWAMQEYRPVGALR